MGLGLCSVYGINRWASIEVLASERRWGSVEGLGVASKHKTPPRRPGRSPTPSPINPKHPLKPKPCRRMSVVVREPSEGRLLLLTKGADSAILERLASKWLHFRV